MSHNATLVWFRRDLRLADNPALQEAAMRGSVLPVFILDQAEPIGAASCWWLHHSLKSLDNTLASGLVRLRGDPQTLIIELLQQAGIKRVAWNRVWEPYALARDNKLEQQLAGMDIEVRIHDSALLWRPDQVLKKDGTPYKVFTPYYRNGCLNQSPPRYPLAQPAELAISASPPGSLALEQLALLPEIRWDEGLTRRWQPGEFGAHARLEQFFRYHLKGYDNQRDRPDLSATSSFSPHLHFGEISPNQIWYLTQQHADEQGWNQDHDSFLSELAWREFSSYLLYHWPDLPQRNFREHFDRFPWKPDERLLLFWQSGQTGIPLVDAGMRELWQTGFMHNRVRMICGSFLVKNLLQDWRSGADWFADTLVDADLASNSASWQWVAGSGADAAPYFRIFNPVMQGKKFDPEGDYIKRYCPELASVPSRWIHAPWSAPEAELEKAGVVLGQHYPRPIVDLANSRDKALMAYKTIKDKANHVAAG